MTRRYSSTAQPTTLAAGCTSSATTIQVTATTGFPAVDFVLALDYGAAGQELVLCTNVAGTTLTVTRGYNSTPASAHAIAAAVRHVHAAQDFTDSRTHEAATSGVHGIAGSVVGTTDVQTVSNKDLSSGTNTFPAALATDAEVTSAVSTHAALTATHGATGAVVGTTNVQTLTNKTLTAPVIDTLAGVTGIGERRYVEKTVDQGPVASSAVFVDDTTLQFSVVANAVYEVTWTHLFSGSANTGGLKWQVVGPAGATGDLGIFSAQPNVTYSTVAAALPLGSSFVPSIGDGFSTALPCALFGTVRIKTSGTAGTVKVQFAQQTANVTGVTSKAGSHLTITRVA